MLSTAVHKLPYLTPNDKAKNIPDQSKAMALELERLIESGALDGKPGKQGLPGVNALPADQAVATYMGTDGTKTQDVAAAISTRFSDRAVTTRYVAANGVIPEHYITILINGDRAGKTLHRIVGGDSNAIAPPQETLDKYYERTGASVLINASGWWSGLGNRLMGLSIKNGVLIQDWETDPTLSELGTEALVIMKNGEMRVYDRRTKSADILADGGWNSFSWGAAAYKDGAKTAFQEWSRYKILSARNCLGSTLDGNLIIISFPGSSGTSGATGDHIVAACASLRIKNLYILDGGGSAQLMINGQYTMPSSDATPRPVPDALAFYAPVAGTVQPRRKQWTAVTIRGAGFTGGAVEYLVTETDVHVRVANVAASGTGSLRNASTLPPQVPKPLWNWTGGGYLNTAPTESQNNRIGPAGNIDLSNSAAGTLYWLTSYPY